MSGHSKWATIKRRKGLNDAKKAKTFTKILKEITISCRGNTADPNANPRLRLAIDKAKSNNVPKENIERAIKKGLGETGGARFEDYMYEGYGPCGVALLVEALSDNKNRTGGEIRSIFTKSGNSMAEAGAVSWNFDRKGMITLFSKKEEEVFEQAMQLNIDDIEEQEGNLLLYCALEHLDHAAKTLEKDYKIEYEITMKPKTLTLVQDLEEAKKLLELIEKLEDNDDVQKVYSNFDISHETLLKLSL